METRLSGRLLMLQSKVSAIKRSFSSYLFLGCLFLCLFNWSFPVSPLPCRRHLPPLINRRYLQIFLKVPQSVLPSYTCQEVRVCVCVCLCVSGGGGIPMSSAEYVRQYIVIILFWLIIFVRTAFLSLCSSYSSRSWFLWWACRSWKLFKIDNSVEF